MNSLISPFNPDNQLSAPSAEAEPSAGPSTPSDHLPPQVSTPLGQLRTLFYLFLTEIGYLICLGYVLTC